MRGPNSYALPRPLPLSAVALIARRKRPLPSRPKGSTTAAQGPERNVSRVSTSDPARQATQLSCSVNQVNGRRDPRPGVGALSGPTGLIQWSPFTLPLPRRGLGQ